MKNISSDLEVISATDIISHLHLRERKKKREERELPPALKTDSGLSSLRHPQNTNQESQTLEVREQVNHPSDRLSVEDQISLKNSAAGRRGRAAVRGSSEMH